MLNSEQLLIKTAEYFGLNLDKLGIRRNPEKTRLYKRQLIKESIEHIIKKLCTEVESLEINPFIKNIINEFMEHYDYITKEIYGTFDETREKEIDWLILKHFVIPFFAIRLSQDTSFYDERIDKGLPGGDFWYLPTYDANNSKIPFPLNKLMKWLIDLHGGSNQDFYFMRKYYFDENNKFDIADSTLKKWHHNFVIPEIETIKEFTSFKFKYDGIFKKDEEEPFKSAIDFIASKSLTIEKLKREVPNKDNILDRLYSETLTNEEKSRFVLYIEERWAKPGSEQLEWLFTIARVSQLCYKELCAYFNVDVKDESIDNNKVLQMVSFFSYIYNTELELQLNGQSDVLELFGLYIHNIKIIEENKKEGLDLIMGSITNELMQHENYFTIDEVIVVSGSSEENRNRSILNLYENEIKKEKDKIQNEKIYKSIEYIENIKDDVTLQKYIMAIKDTQVLHNIGDYFQGNNYLTNDPVQPNLIAALTIHVQYSRVAESLLDKQNAYGKVLNILTFPYYPRMLEKIDVDVWLTELEKIFDDNSWRSKLMILSFKGYHMINQKNTIEIVSLINKFIELTKNLKAEEYNPQFLFVAQDYMNIIDNKIMFKKLNKINDKHPLFLTHLTTHGSVQFQFFK